MVIEPGSRYSIQSHFDLASLDSVRLGLFWAQGTELGTGAETNLRNRSKNALVTVMRTELTIRQLQSF